MCIIIPGTEEYHNSGWLSYKTIKYKINNLINQFPELEILFMTKYNKLYHGLCKQIYFKLKYYESKYKDNEKKDIHNISNKILHIGGMNALLTCYYILMNFIPRHLCSACWRKYISCEIRNIFNNELFNKLLDVNKNIIPYNMRYSPLYCIC